MDRRPNFLIVMPDQMRGDCLSIENHPVLETPHIDGIGMAGVHFTRAYTTCASCIAARRSLLTGEFPGTSGVVGYREGIPITSPTLTELLRDSGYATAIAGRNMHQSPSENPYGFERRVLGSTYVEDDDYARYLDEQAPDLGGIRGIGLSCNGREAKPWPVDDELHPTCWTIREARRLLSESNAEQPLLLVASFYAPHPPLFPPARYLDDYLEMDLPPAVIGEWETPPPRETFDHNVDASRVNLKGEELRQAQAGYFGLIKHLDDLLPGLVEDFRLKSEKDGRPWLVVFTSDHGEMLGDHYLFRKCEPYEGSSRIPLLIQGSPVLRLSAGTECSRPVCLEDIMPTLLELANVPVPANVDGCSLVSLLRGRQEAVRTTLHGEHAPCYDLEQGYHFLTDGKMKYIWRPNGGTEQLFDLQDDPKEERDLSKRPENTAVMSLWRLRLIDQLRDRPEGFSDGTKLIPHRPYNACIESVSVL